MDKTEMGKLFRAIVKHCTSKQVFSDKDEAMKTWAKIEFGKDAIWAYEFYKTKGRFPTSKEI